MINFDTKMGWDTVWAIFVTNLSGHPDPGRSRSWQTIEKKMADDLSDFLAPKKNVSAVARRPFVATAFRGFKGRWRKNARQKRPLRHRLPDIFGFF
jgi:hypothetical protein